MGNTLATETQGGYDLPNRGSRDDDENYWHGSNPNIAPRGNPPPPPGQGPPLQRRRSSFLEEPVTHKLTERGEATVSLRNSGGSGGRDGSCNKLQYAVSEMQGWRSHMEDKHALNPDLSKSHGSSSQQQHAKLLEDHHLFAVFDGHGGDFASHFCGTYLVDTLTSQKDWIAYLKLCESTSSNNNSTKYNKRQSVQGLQLLKSALTSTFLSLDEKLIDAQRKIRMSQLSQIENFVYSVGGNPSQHDVFHEGTSDHERILNFDRQLPQSLPAGVQLERSGSTGVVVLLTPHHIICANAGDSRAILSTKNEVLPLSFDHKPSNDVEVTRVENDGGFVRSGRVDGDLAVSRSFGDFGYKNCSERSAQQSFNGTRGRSVSSLFGKIAGPKDHRVTVHPDILVHTRDPYNHEFVVLACDGIWDRLTNKDCADLVKSLVHDEGETDVGLICEEVIDTALELDSRDNMTCCVVLFPSISNTLSTSSRINKLTSSSSSSSRSSFLTPSVGVMKRRYERQRSWGHNSTPVKRAQLRLEERRKKHREMLALQKAKSTAATNKVQPLRRQASSSASSVAGGTTTSVANKKARNVSPPRNKKLGRVRGPSTLRRPADGVATRQ